jgi:hypothetical protein
MRKISIILILVFISCSSCRKFVWDNPYDTTNPSSEPASLKNGLIAYYPFSGNSADSSSNANHGTVNGATLTSDRFGNSNSAYFFANSTISVPYKSYLSFSDTKKISVSFWVFTAINNVGNHFIGMRQPGTKTQFWQIYTAYTPTEKGILFGSWTNGTLNGVFAQNRQIPINAWTHVIASYENSSWKLYINGVLIASTSTSIKFDNDVNTPLTFGNSGNFDPFNGRLDDIRIYNRALTQEEITYLANN